MSKEGWFAFEIPETINNDKPINNFFELKKWLLNHSGQEFIQNLAFALKEEMPGQIFKVTWKIDRIQ